MREAQPQVADLSQLSAPERFSTMVRVINGAGQRCNTVDQIAYQQRYRGKDMWVAHCSGGKAWAVYTDARGRARVSACELAARSGLPACTALDRTSAAGSI